MGKEQSLQDYRKQYKIPAKDKKYQNYFIYIQINLSMKKSGEGGISKNKITIREGRDSKKKNQHYQGSRIIYRKNKKLKMRGLTQQSQILRIKIYEITYIIQICSMGNQQQAVIEHQPFKSSHPLYQEAFVIKEGGKNYIQSRQPVQDKEYQGWKNVILDKKSPLNHQFLLLPQHTGYQHDKEMCGKSGTAINNYPYFPNSLADQIKRRKPDNSYFKESELWYLLLALVNAKNDLRNYGGKIGDIKPENIFIDNNGSVKIGNLFSSPKETNAFTKAKDYANPNLNVFLAPEDFADLVKNSIDNKANNQSEIFAIGLTVLAAGLLDDCRGIYNYKKLQFNVAELNLRKDHWSEHSKYSQIFKSIILNLVDQSPAKRISGNDLYKFISKYENPIKAKEQFIISHPPENLQTGVSIVRSKIH